MNKNLKTTNTEKMLPPIKPKIDFAFKMLFSGYGEQSAILLTDLLNAIIGLEGDKKIAEIVYLNPYIGREHENDKASIMDIKVRTKDGTLIDIEMQLNNADDYRKRTLYYWSRLYGETAVKGKAYRELKKCIVISIMDFILFRNTSKYHRVFEVRERYDGEKLLEDLELHYLELPKFVERENVASMNNLQKWLTFLKYAGEEEKEDIITKLIKESEVFEMASVILRQMSEDERIRQEYFYREKIAMDEQSKIRHWQLEKEEARKKGFEEGRKEGRKEAQKETAVKALKQGFSIEQVAAITGLSIEEIQKLQEN